MKRRGLALILFLLWGACALRVYADAGRVIAASVTNGALEFTYQSTNGFSYLAQSLPWATSRFWNDLGSPTGASTQVGSIQITPVGADGFLRVMELTNSVFWYDWAYYYQEATLSAWGFGAAQNSYTHTDRAYDWYIDQADTGTCSGNNCGPSSVTMAIKWYDGTRTNTAEGARNTYYNSCGWWYTSDIINYLNLNSIPNTTTAYTGTNQLMQILSQSNLVILCISTAYLTRNYTAEHRVDRFYDYASGHFVVIKGWRNVAGAVYFESYDPNNWHATYSDGTPKGRNRHFRAQDLSNAIVNWWNYLIVVSPAGGGGRSLRSLAPAVDPATVVHQWGR